MDMVELQSSLKHVSRLIAIDMNTCFMVGMRWLSYGCTTVVAKHKRSVRIAQFNS